MTEPTEEARIVAAAMVRQRWGDSGAVDVSDIRKAEQFIAAADALIAFRMAQNGPKGMVVCQENRIGDQIHWPADGTSEPGLERKGRPADDGGLDRNEESDGA